MIRKPLYALLLAALWTSCVGRPAAIDAALAELVGTEALAGGRIGVMVADAATGNVLAEHDSDRGFATASNMKLLASAVALQVLGPDYVARTELVARGRLLDGVLRGNLLLRGQGDPTLGAEAVQAFVAAVKAAGIRRVEGIVIGDGSWLGEERLGRGWQWDYLDADYAAPFGGLCLDGNVIAAVVRPGRDGAEVSWSQRVPPEPGIDVAIGATGATRLAATRALGSDRIEIRGTIAHDAREQRLRVAVRDPAGFAAAVLTQQLVAGGVEIGGLMAATEGIDERLIASRDSPPLSEIVGPLLTDSNNLYAEQVWRIAARQAVGRGDTDAAEAHTVALLRAIGIDPAGMVLADGSGLSRRNLVRPHQIAELLLWVHGAPFGELFMQSLPLAGRTGTLRSRFKDGLATGRVRAKTGFIARVVCLSGYLPRPEPGAAPLVFCVMLNDFTCSTDDAKAAVDRFVERLAAIAGWGAPVTTATP